LPKAGIKLLGMVFFVSLSQGKVEKLIETKKTFVERPFFGGYSE